MAKGKTRSRKYAKRGRSRSRRHRMRGGAQTFSPSPVNVSLAGSSPSQMNLGQGRQYGEFHVAQHGGMAPYPGGVTGSVLPQELTAAARVQPLNQYLADVRGVRDPGQGNQMGGRRGVRKSRGRKSRGRKTRGRKVRRSTRRMRKMYGGAAEVLAPMNVTAPTMLLDARGEANAVRGMNPEWLLAPNPNSFAPKG